MKQKRVLKRMTLLVIAEILQIQHALTSRAVADATQLAPCNVRQIFKRLSSWGWLARDVRPGQETRRGARQRYRLMPKGRIEGSAALRRQASLVGWDEHTSDAGDLGARTPVCRKLSHPRGRCFSYK